MDTLNDQDEVGDMAQKLFVIGNGFDLHHGIPSQYSNFGRYVEERVPRIHELINEYLLVDEDFWNNFEERLAHFDYDKVVDNAENFLVPYSAEDWSDAYHHDFEYEIEQVVDGLSRELRACFAEWIRQLPIPNKGNAPKVVCIDPNDRFLNFNYTPSLQRLYDVPQINVLHIHGSSSDLESEIVLGHGWEPQADEKMSRQVDENTDTRVAGGYYLIDKYFSETFKPTGLIIERHRAFFEGLKFTNEVYVLGHSLADVDACYFEEIAANVGSSAKWVISYYGEPASVKANFARFGIPDAFVRFEPLRAL